MATSSVETRLKPPETPQTNKVKKEVNESELSTAMIGLKAVQDIAESSTASDVKGSVS